MVVTRSASRQADSGYQSDNEESIDDRRASRRRSEAARQRPRDSRGRFVSESKSGGSDRSRSDRRSSRTGAGRKSGGRTSSAMKKGSDSGYQSDSSYDDDDEDDEESVDRRASRSRSEAARQRPRDSLGRFVSESKSGGNRASRASKRSRAEGRGRSVSGSGGNRSAAARARPRDSLGRFVSTPDAGGRGRSGSGGNRSAGGRGRSRSARSSSRTGAGRKSGGRTSSAMKDGSGTPRRMTFRGPDGRFRAPTPQEREQYDLPSKRSGRRTKAAARRGNSRTGHSVTFDGAAKS